MRLFRRKKKKRDAGDDSLDEFAEDQCKIDDAVLTMVAMSRKYGSAGTDEMIVYVAGQLGNKIMLRGSGRWQI